MQLIPSGADRPLRPVPPVTHIIPDCRTLLEVWPYRRGGPPIHLPLIGQQIPAGFPSPSDDYIDGRLDLNDFVVTHPEATFFAIAIGTSMVRAGISNGDLLVVDRALEPRHGDVVVAIVNGEHTVKRFKNIKGRPTLLAEPDPCDTADYKPIAMVGEGEYILWGVVKNVVKTFRP